MIRKKTDGLNSKKMLVLHFLPDLSENPPGKFGGEEFMAVKCNNSKEVEATGCFCANVFWHFVEGD